MPTIYQIIIVALLVAFIVLATSISGIRDKARDWCDKYNAPIIAKMLNCDFCFSFWTGILISLVLVMITKDASYMIIPILSTPITRLLL